MKNNTATKQELINSIKGMEEIVNDPDTSEDIKASIRPSIANAKKELEALEAAEKNEHIAEKKEKKVDTAKPASRPVVEKARAVVAKTKKKTTAQKQHIKKTVLPDLKKTIQKAKKVVASTRGASQDAHIKAKSPGRRKSASGNRYYEYRSNRSDQQRRKFPYLERGGELEFFFDECVDKAKHKTDIQFAEWLEATHPNVYETLQEMEFSDETMRHYFLQSGERHEEFARGGQTLKGIREDKQRKALHPGWRVSENGEVYFEARPNRSDKSRIKKLEKGGDVSRYTVPAPKSILRNELKSLDKDSWFVEAKGKVISYSARTTRRIMEIFSTGLYKIVDYKEEKIPYRVVFTINAPKGFAQGGVTQSPAQNPDYNYRNDKGESAKPVGWRYTEEGAKKLKVKETAIPSAAHLKKYKGKSFSVKGEKHFYLYYETRKDKSDVSRSKRLEEGGTTNIQDQIHDGTFNPGPDEFANGGAISLTSQQEQILSKSYDWLIAVVQKQKRWLSDEDIWTAYPYKKEGLSKHGLTVLIAKTKETLQELKEDHFEDGGELPSGSIADARYQPTFDIHSPLFEKGGILHQLATQYSIPVTDENQNEITDLQKHGLVAIENGKAWITGRGMKQINSKYTEFEDGGALPAYFGSGQNINVFGYETQHFSNSADVVHEFKKAIAIIESEDDGSAYSHSAKEALKECARNVDAILSIEQKIVEGMPFNTYELVHAIRMSTIYDYKSGLHVDMNVMDKHIKNSLDALYRNEHRHLFAKGGPCSE